MVAIRHNQFANIKVVIGAETSWEEHFKAAPFKDIVTKEESFSETDLIGNFLVDCLVNHKEKCLQTTISKHFNLLSLLLMSLLEIYWLSRSNFVF